MLLLFFNCSLDPVLFDKANKFTGSIALVPVAKYKKQSFTGGEGVVEYWHALDSELFIVRHELYAKPKNGGNGTDVPFKEIRP